MKSWEQRVQELEQEGLTRSDAQSVADVEVGKGLIKPDFYLKNRGVIKVNKNGYIIYSKGTQNDKGTL